MEKRTDLNLKERSGTSDLVIVSAYGRGNWLACELSGRGWSVTLIDVSQSLGEGDPEDGEGPFGIFDSSDLLPSQKNFFHDKETVPSGFTVWLEDGPLECRSDLTEFQLAQKGLAPVLESYLRRPLSAAREARRDLASVKKQSYKSAWLAHLAHQITSPFIVENQTALEAGAAAPLFSPFAIRSSEAGEWKRGLKACEEKGVKVLTPTELTSIGMHGRGVDRLEVSLPTLGDKSGESRMIGARTFVWTLSSAETEQLSGEVSRHLYPKGPVAEDWYWARYEVELAGEVFAEQIPSYLVLISDLFLPWTNANLLILRKRSSGVRQSSTVKMLDVWLRLPSSTRAQVDGLAKLKTEIEKRLLAKIPFAKPRVVKVPHPPTLGPVRFPIFEPETLNRLQTLRAPNLFFCSVEQCDSQDWLGHYRLQNSAVSRLEKLKAQWVSAANKLAMRAEKRARRAAR